jgi:hypothetical protein
MSSREEVAHFAGQIHAMRALRKAAVVTIHVARRGARALPSL